MLQAEYNLEVMKIALEQWKIVHGGRTLIEVYEELKKELDK